MDTFFRWAKREYRITARIVATLIAGSVFVFAIPYFLLMLSKTIDRWLSIPCFHHRLASYLLGGLIIITGLLFAIWSVAVQVFRARGTPLPMMATKKLLISGPFQYCRNPMSFGILLHYSGIAVWVGSLSALAIAMICAILLILYIKCVEEHELEQRFGQEYREYKRTTPLLIPKVTLKD